MVFLRNIVTGLRSLFRKEQVDRELNEELRAYQDMATEEKIKQGMSPKDALRAVRLERGSLEVANPGGASREGRGGGFHGASVDRWTVTTLTR